MVEQEWLAERFEEHRSHLRSVAYRMLGSSSEADDAVQEAWLRLSRSNADEIEQFGAWLTTVVGRVALNMLRARRVRKEEVLEDFQPGPVASSRSGADPEHEAIMADSVGLAMMVVLEMLTPPERLAYVLHDMFAVPFDEISAILDRTPDATRQLASRARRRVRGAAPIPDDSPMAEREVVEAFLAAARDGDFLALVAVLDPDVVLRAEIGTASGGERRVVRGAELVASQAQAYSRIGLTVHRVRIGEKLGLLALQNGQPYSVGSLEIRDGKIVEIEILADPERIRQMDLTVLDT